MRAVNLYTIGAGSAKNVNFLINEHGINPDLITTIYNKTPEATIECSKFAEQFRGANNTETARNIWNFLKKNIPYKADGPTNQRIKGPNRIIDDAKKGIPTDCKSFSLFTVGCLRALGLPAYYRYASYSMDPTPTHVYALTKDEQGKTIIIDGVYHGFNIEPPYNSKTDVNMKVEYLSGPSVAAPMQVVRPVNTIKAATGNTLQRLAQKVRPGSLAYYAIRNELNRQNGVTIPVNYSKEELNRYARRLSMRLANPARINPAIRQVLTSELNIVNSGRFNGSIPPARKSPAIRGYMEEISGDFERDELQAVGKFSLKKVGRSLKKLSLKKIFRAVKATSFIIPRKSFLALVALNVRGLATRLSKARPDGLKKEWERLGGKFSVLQGAINRGKNKRPLLGGGKIKSVHGIGGIEAIHYGPGQEPVEGIGVAPAVGAWLAAASTVLAAMMKFLKKEGVPETPGASDSEVMTEARENGLQSITDNVMTFASQAARTAAETGLLPERPITNETEREIDNSMPGDDHVSGNEKSGLTKYLIPAAAIGTGLYLLNRS